MKQIEDRSTKYIRFLDWTEYVTEFDYKIKTFEAEEQISESEFTEGDMEILFSNVDIVLGTTKWK